MLNYNSVRLMLFAVVMLAIYLILRASKLQNKRRIKTVSMIVCLALLFVSWFIPIENCMFSFPTVESAFKYSDSEGEIIAVIDGIDSAMVVYQGKKGDVPTIFPKIGDGYGVRGFPIFKSRTMRVPLRTGAENMFYFTVYSVRNTTDTYLMAWEAFGTKRLDIQDNLGSEFIFLDSYSGFSYYIYAKDFNPETYAISIDGETYTYEDFNSLTNLFFGQN